MKFYLCDPMPWRYSAWLLLNTRRQHYGRIPNIHVLQRLFGIYTLAVTSALPSTKPRRIKFLTYHATLFPVRVRRGRKKLYNEGFLSFSLPLPNTHTHLSTWKKKTWKSDFYLVIHFAVQESNPRASYMTTKCITTAPKPDPRTREFWSRILVKYCKVF